MDKQAGNVEAVGEEVRRYLGMGYRPVGIKFSQRPLEGERPAKPIAFCRTVKDAALGKDLVVTPEDEDCPDAEVVLGFRQSRYVNIEPRVKERIAAIRVGPLHDADVVLLILNAEQAMVVSFLLDGVTARFGGNVSVCGEAAAKVYLEKEPNVSFLCQGARVYGEYDSSELMVALPYHIFLELPGKMNKFHALGQKAKAGLARLLLKLT